MKKFKAVFEFNESDLTDQSIPLSNCNNKALGVFWKPMSDRFSFSTQIENLHRNVTKRLILSAASNLFGLIGLLAPVTVTAKLIIQEIWQLNLNWDETIAMSLHSH